MRAAALLLASLVWAETAPMVRVLSPSGQLALEYRDCSLVEPCKAEMRVTDADGRIDYFVPTPAPRFEKVFWIGEDRIGLTLKVSPSTSEYIELDRTTGEERQRLLGLWFTPSPDLKWVAHAGFLTHSAPPSASGYTVEVNDRVLYPLPKGSKPVIRRDTEQPPAVIDCRDTGEMQQVCRNIHQIYARLVWAPDSRHLAFTESVSTVKQTWNRETGGASTDYMRTECFAVVVALDGRFRRLALPEGDCYERSVKWVDSKTVETDGGGKLGLP